MFNNGQIKAYNFVQALNQTAGRGRNGHIWETPTTSDTEFDLHSDPKEHGDVSVGSGTALTFSTAVTFPDTDFFRENMQVLSLLAGVSVYQMLQQLGINKAHLDLKWPNDVLLNGRKVSGVLAEFLGKRDHSLWFSVGVGLNVKQTEKQLPKNCKIAPTSLALEGFYRPEFDDSQFYTVSIISNLIALVEGFVESRGVLDFSEFDHWDGGVLE
jgi:biotin-(acetyl-CoA carboxylase) ligase